MLSPLPGPYRLSFSDWCQFPDDARLYEIIDGELFMTPPPSIAHQRASGRIQFRLTEYLRRTQAGELFDAPVGVRLDDENVVEPDLLVVLSVHAARVGTQVIEGAPDLVVEVLSPGTARHDLGLKRELYARHGVAEYWIVDTQTRSIEVFRLETGLFTRAGLYRPGEQLTSPLLTKFELDVAEVFL
jgi:Uma2 family endonuclease